MVQEEYSCSVIVPCYNEKGNVESCVERVPRMGSSTEIVFVDDGSSDGTSQKVRDCMKLREDIDVRLVTYSPNHGKGFAVRKGFNAARSDVVMILDADLAVPPEELPGFFEILSTGKAGFANGTRFVHPMEPGAMRRLNRIGNRIFSLLFSCILGQRISDTLCGTKALFRKDYESIEMGECPWGDFDLLIGAGRLGLQIREVPVHYKKRVAGESKMHAFRHGWQLLKVCLRGSGGVRPKRCAGH